MVIDRPRRRRLSGLYLPFVLVPILITGLAVATQVRPVNLEQMTERADRIFAGRCVSTSVVEHEALGRKVTEATFEVERVAKGELDGTVTVRFAGADADSTTGGSVAGVPRFEVGEEVILFLYPDSSHGLTSPVGLGQGKFRVVEDKSGRRLALNAFGNGAVFRGLSEEARARLDRDAPQVRRTDGATIESAELFVLVESLLR